MTQYEYLKKDLDDLESIAENIKIDQLTQEVYRLENEINSAKQDSYEDGEWEKFDGLSKRIKKIKEDFDFYDEEAELDNMFPNRQDNDFDPEDTSYDSVFGDD